MKTDEIEGLSQSCCGIFAYPENPVESDPDQCPCEKETIVASFCSKCGAELSLGVQSCTACGAAVGPVAVATPPPVAVPAKSGNNALKIVLIVLAIFIGLGILGAGAFGYFVWRVAHAVHVAGSGSDVTIHTPGGTLTANPSETYTASDLGTDIYPGAQSGKGGMRMSMPTGTMVSAVYLTNDTKDQVLAFYKTKFGSDASVFDSADGTVLTVNKGQKESIVVTITKGTSDNEGKTEIHIVHTTANKPS
jgi:hypothetical protein